MRIFPLARKVMNPSKRLVLVTGPYVDEFEQLWCHILSQRFSSIYREQELDDFEMRQINDEVSAILCFVEVKNFLGEANSILEDTIRKLEAQFTDIPVFLIYIKGGTFKVFLTSNQTRPYSGDFFPNSHTLSEFLINKIPKLKPPPSPGRGMSPVRSVTSRRGSVNSKRGMSPVRSVSPKRGMSPVRSVTSRRGSVSPVRSVSPKRGMSPVRSVTSRRSNVSPVRSVSPKRGMSPVRSVSSNDLLHTYRNDCITLLHQAYKSRAQNLINSTNLEDYEKLRLMTISHFKALGKMVVQ